MQDSKGIQLNKYIALSGVCSRRRAEELIKEGKISVNYEVVTDCGYRVQPEDIVTNIDEHLHPEKKVYILLNKPKDTITTTKDNLGRKTVLDLIEKQIKARLFPIGRLDRSTTGVLVLTNDGELAQKMAHPKFNIQKTYIVTLDRPFNHDDYLDLLKGVKLSDGFVRPDGVYYIGGKKTVIKVLLHSGKNRVVRRMFEHLDYRVNKLDRINFGAMTKQSLKPGQWKLLSYKDVESLLKPMPRSELKPRIKSDETIVTPRIAAINSLIKDKPKRTYERDTLRKPTVRKSIKPAPQSQSYFDDEWDNADEPTPVRTPTRTGVKPKSYREDWDTEKKSAPLRRSAKPTIKPKSYENDEWDNDEPAPVRTSTRTGVKPKSYREDWNAEKKPAGKRKPSTKAAPKALTFRDDAWYTSENPRLTRKSNPKTTRHLEDDEWGNGEKPAKVRKPARPATKPLSKQDDSWDGEKKPSSLRKPATSNYKSNRDDAWQGERKPATKRKPADKNSRYSDEKPTAPHKRGRTAPSRGPVKKRK